MVTPRNTTNERRVHIQTDEGSSALFRLPAHQWLIALKKAAVASIQKHQSGERARSGKLYRDGLDNNEDCKKKKQGPLPQSRCLAKRKGRGKQKGEKKKRALGTESRFRERKMAVSGGFVPRQQFTACHQQQSHARAARIGAASARVVYSRRKGGCSLLLLESALSLSKPPRVSPPDGLAGIISHLRCRHRIPSLVFGPPAFSPPRASRLRTAPGTDLGASRSG
ncbi:hypothetical protein MRX96_000379 [Rhipicephalus microplus]